MELMYWWLALLVLIALIVGEIILRRKRAAPPATAKPIANSWRLRQLPAYQRTIRRYRLLLQSLVAIAGVGLLASLLLVGRLSSITLTTPEFKNRDIMLCLDVSGSMTDTDAAITKLFAKMAKGFTKERIGLVVFDSSPAVIFPLTNDYRFVSERLTAVSTAFSNTRSTDYSAAGMAHFYDIYAGTSENSGASLIGDGLASCVNRFDRLDSKRSRSVILGTDNYVNGSPIVTLQEAASFATQKDIRVYGINPADFGYQSYTTPEAEDYKKAMLATKGDYYKLDDVSAVPTIINKISSQDATRFKGTPQLIQTDTPQTLVVITLLAICALMIAVWRLKL